MGLILDSSIAIQAERAQQSPSLLVRQIMERVGSQDVALSAIGYTELIHGTHRGTSNAQRTLSRAFLSELVAALPVYDYTRAAAEIAGRIDAEQRALGFPIPFSDLLIGATAVSLGYSVLTTNLRHFRMIPGLNVIAF